MARDDLNDLEICRQLVESADELRYDDPRAAVLRAESARDLAASFDRARVGDGPWLRLQAAAWSTLASTYRYVGELHRAESAIAVALAFLGELEGELETSGAEHPEPELRPRLAQRASYVRCDQGRFSEALELNLDAVRSFRRLGDPHLVATALLDRALIYHRAGRTRDAIPVLAEAIEDIDREIAPRSYLAAVHNMAVYLERVAESREEIEETLHWLALAIREHSRLPERINLLKLRLLMALCQAKLGGMDRAKDEMWRVRGAFGELGSVSHEALVLLHLAGLAIDEDDGAEIQRIAGLVFPLLGKLRKDDSARAALLEFLSACRDNALSREVLGDVLERVERAA